MIVKKTAPSIVSGVSKMFQKIDKYHVRGLVVETLAFELPLDHSKPKNNQIRICAQRINPSKTDASELEKRPYVVFFQGGPGFQCTPPLSKSGFIDELIQRGFQVLALDQRGTGMSTAICPEELGKMETEKAADYLTHFRADSIVRDAEMIRKVLCGEQGKWTIMGQSFGGFCCFTYLSFFPEYVKQAIVTGGIPPTADNPDKVYKALYPVVAHRNKYYYDKYPEDQKRVSFILDYLRNNKIQFPNGGNLSPERFQQLGLSLGSHNGADTIHLIVLRLFDDLEVNGRPSFFILDKIQAMHSFDTNPIYAILHESIYCQQQSSDWSADRLRADFQEFVSAEGKKPTYLTGEMIYKSMFEDYVELRQLKPVAELLAQKKDWPDLYDYKQLKNNKVPIVAATYFSDMYVEFGLVQETARETGNVKQWITNEYFHGGLRANPKEVLGHLFDLLEVDFE